MGWIFLEKLWRIDLDYESTVLLNMARYYDTFWQSEWWFDESAGTWAYYSHSHPFIMHFNGYLHRSKMLPAYRRLLDWHQLHNPQTVHGLMNATVYVNGHAFSLFQVCSSTPDMVSDAVVTFK